MHPPQRRRPIATRPDRLSELVEERPHRLDTPGLDIGDAIHISNISLPDGVEPAITDRDFTVATLVAPSAMKSEEDEAAATAEGEVPTVGDEDAAEGGEGEAEGGESE